MKTLFSFILLSIILLQTFAGAIIIINFELNRSYVEKTFCENKDKPKSNCHGSCHLKKQLHDEESPKSSNPTIPLKQKVNDLLFYQWSEFEILDKYSEIKNAPSISCHQIHLGNIYLMSVFHPPEII